MSVFVLEAVPAQRLQDVPDQRIHPVDQRPVGRPGPQDEVVGNLLDAAPGAPPCLERVQPVVERRADAGQGHAVAVPVEVGAAGDVGGVREHETHRQAERLVGHSRAPADPVPVQEVDGRRGHVLVVHLVAALSGAGRFERSTRLPGHLSAAGMVGPVVADRPLGVAVELVDADRVHAAHQHGPVAGGAHGVREGGVVAAQDVVVGPHVDLVRVLAGQHRHPRRHADR